HRAGLRGARDHGGERRALRVDLGRDERDPAGAHAEATSPVSAQLVLDLHLRDGSSFDNFLAAANREALQAVRAIAASERPAVMFVWGEVGSGRTHLLQAACRALQQLERDAAYVPLAAASELSPALLEDREHA